MTHVTGIGVARTLSGVALFLAKKLTTFFSRRPQLKDRLNMPPNLTRPAKNCPKNWLLLWLGVHFVFCGGALTHFPCKLRLKKIFFHRPGGAGAPTAPHGYAYGHRSSGPAPIPDHTESLLAAWRSLLGRLTFYSWFLTFHTNIPDGQETPC